jgi:phenylalanyl-tRNA synthetase beta chain
MPTITVSFEDFQELLGKRIGLKEFEELIVLYAKAEVEKYDEKTKEASIKFDDTNLPYIWSSEGLARFFKGILGKQKGIPKIEIKRGDNEIIVDKSVKKIRPHIATFVAEGKKIEERLLLQLIQLQEKFDEGYGSRREKVSIGMYSHEKIKFPITYKAVPPHSIKFIPLEGKSELTPAQILKQHPKGREYGWIVENHQHYPILIDSKNQILSLVPIINSHLTGKLTVGETQLLFEATGTDRDAVHLAANIFAQNLYERGFTVYSTTIKDGTKTTTTPHNFNDKIKVTGEDVEKILGLGLKESQIKALLEKAQYDYNNSVVKIPNYRRDIMHPVDVIEDIAIMYGFNNIESLQVKGYTTGATTDTVKFVDTIREISVGLGFQEVMSHILSNKGVLYEKMNTADIGTVEIANTMSETFSTVRSWLLPMLMEVLSKNKHVDYPQKIFEQGLVTLRTGNLAEDAEKAAFALSHSKADFTEMKQALDGLMNSLGATYTVEESSEGAFIEGRSGKIRVNGKTVGIIGEIHPAVLVNWGLEMPVSALEINLTELKKLLSI